MNFINNLYRVRTPIDEKGSDRMQNGSESGSPAYLESRPNYGKTSFIQSHTPACLESQPDYGKTSFIKGAVGEVKIPRRHQFPGSGIS